MILFPAIDLKDGACVRLKHGDMNAVTIFNDDPSAQAIQFEILGFEWLHLVDLNGAFAGKPVNAAAVEDILRSIRIPVQLGGGIRDLATIESWLSKGVSRVILGTAAVQNPSLVREACKEFPGKIAVGIDARGGKVAVQGWAETSDLSSVELVSRFENSGVSAIIFTDIDRDGVLQGINIEATLALAKSTTVPIIASGGLASMDDLDRLSQPECSILEGVISGRAIYDGAIDPKLALAALAKKKSC